MFTKYLITFFISMVPLVELRGGVPFGTGMDLPWHWCLIVCMIGNMMPLRLKLVMVVFWDKIII